MRHQTAFASAPSRRRCRDVTGRPRSSSLCLRQADSIETRASQAARRPCLHRHVSMSITKGASNERPPHFTSWNATQELQQRQHRVRRVQARVAGRHGGGLQAVCPCDDGESGQDPHDARTRPAVLAVRPGGRQPQPEPVRAVRLCVRPADRGSADALQGPQDEPMGRHGQLPVCLRRRRPSLHVQPEGSAEHRSRLSRHGVVCGPHRLRHRRRPQAEAADRAWAVETPGPAIGPGRLSRPPATPAGRTRPRR